MSPIPAGVAAGHPATAGVGIDVLSRGGSAADAVAAMILAGCVAETIFCGLGGGGFATFFDAGTQTVSCLDFFVAVPGLDGTRAAPARDIEVSFAGVRVPYAVGGATVAVPGTPSGAAELHRRHGRLPWAEIVSPAITLATRGAPLPAAHADLLVEVAPAMLIGEGIQAYTRPSEGGRRLIAAGEVLHHDGLARTLSVLAEQGPAPLLTGPIGVALVAAARADGGALSMADMASYRVVDLPVVSARLGEVTVHVRGNDLDNFAGTLRALDLEAVRRDGPDRARALVAALRSPVQRAATTSVVAVDPQGNACAATHSLGLGSGVWVGGVHANSMLGEGELLRGDLPAGARMGSMMVPLVVTDAGGALIAAGGAAGGSRIRPALVQVLTGMVIQGRGSVAATAAPRLAAAPDAVHLEPGFPVEVVNALRDDGENVVQWDRMMPYFGGVSVAGGDGPAADPRRGGAAHMLG